MKIKWDIAYLNQYLIFYILYIVKEQRVYGSYHYIIL